MNGSSPPAPPVTPADMEDLKSICSLIQAGRITWTDMVALDSSDSVKAPDWTNSPEEERLIRHLRANLMAKYGHEQDFKRVTDTLITHLFYRSLSHLPAGFRARVDAGRPSA